MPLSSTRSRAASPDASLLSYVRLAAHPDGLERLLVDARADAQRLLAWRGEREIELFYRRVSVLRPGVDEGEALFERIARGLVREQLVSFLRRRRWAAIDACSDLPTLCNFVSVELERTRGAVVDLATERARRRA